MLSVIAGGRDVSRSAERAPFGLDQFDRLAGGIIPAPNSSNPDPRTLAGADGRRDLTRERLLGLLRYDPGTGVFTWLSGKNVGKTAQARNRDGYIVITIDRVQYRAHRLAIFYMTGIWPAHQVDHINLMKSDNRFANLREATQAENHRNRPAQSNNKCGRRGVYWQESAGKWHVSLRHNGKRHYVGLFVSLEAASAAYDEAALRLHREFARPNSTQAVPYSHSQVPSPRPADKPEAGSLLPSVSGAYSPWHVQRPHLEPMARRASE